MDRESPPIAVAFHGCSSGTALRRMPPDAFASSAATACGEPFGTAASRRRAERCRRNGIGYRTGRCVPIGCAERSVSGRRLGPGSPAAAGVHRSPASDRATPSVLRRMRRTLFARGAERPLSVAGELSRGTSHERPELSRADACFALGERSSPPARRRRLHVVHRGSAGADRQSARSPRTATAGVSFDDPLNGTALVRRCCPSSCRCRGSCTSAVSSGRARPAVTTDAGRACATQPFWPSVVGHCMRERVAWRWARWRPNA